ncbi:hypothetical protein TRFO_36813 [Tritrichomonas foetus]|uniref:DH domain-containing protein n=1 Tax=Tritrichomonas foetus TaxID=1144522 RepID=A0A1J4JCX0_9EUKA|nr:hypothetical protein TRFO_36813 [Tritrichomonas foetus]|eukprot:OHS97030.1 hypothetical protein TRFO_36813 [Tritrichomonas foetus]
MKKKFFDVEFPEHPYVIIQKSGQQIRFESNEFILDKTCQEISNQLQLQTSRLKIKTPYFMETLSNDLVVSYSYPFLIYREPVEDIQNIYSLVISSDGFNIFSVFLGVKIENSVVKFPKYKINFLISRFFGKKGIDFKKHVNENFDLPLLNNGDIYFNNRSISENIDIKYLFDICRHNSLIFRCTLSEKAISIINTRMHAIKEIISTEQSYLADLNILYNVFYPQIKEAQILTTDELNIVFGDIPKILHVHATFLDALLKEGTDYSASLANCFIYFAENFMISKNYIGNFNEINTISISIKNNPKLIEIVNKNPDYTHRIFDAYLITPIQRLPRYILLLRELMKYTPKSHPDYEDLSIAMKKINAVTHEIENAGDTVKKVKYIKDLDDRIKSQSHITDFSLQGRDLISEWPVLITNSLTGKKSGRVYFFNDFILISSQSKKGIEKAIFADAIINLKYVPKYQKYNRIAIQLSKKWIIVEFPNFCEQELEGWCFEMARYKEYIITNYPNNIIWREQIMPSTPPTIIYSNGSMLQNQTIVFAGGVTSINDKKKEKSPNVLLNIDDWKLDIDNNGGFSSVGSTIISDKNILYSFGGIRNSQINSNVMYYDFTSPKKQTQWEPYNLISNEYVITARSFHSAVNYEGMMVVFGGIDKNKSLLNDINILTLHNPIWLKIFPNKQSEIPPPRYKHSSCIYKDNLIIHGGSQHHKTIGDLWIFSFETKIWTKIDIKLISRKNHYIFVFGHNLVILGGSNKTSWLLPTVVVNLDTFSTTEYINFGNTIDNLIKFSAVKVSNSQILIYGGFDIHFHFPINGFYLITLPQSLVIQEKVNKISHSLTYTTVIPTILDQKQQISMEALLSQEYLSKNPNIENIESGKLKLSKKKIAQYQEQCIAQIRNEYQIDDSNLKKKEKDIVNELMLELFELKCNNSTMIKKITQQQFKFNFSLVIKDVNKGDTFVSDITGYFPYEYILTVVQSFRQSDSIQIQTSNGIRTFTEKVYEEVFLDALLNRHHVFKFIIRSI